jgi:hypothetical protein
MIEFVLQMHKSLKFDQKTSKICHNFISSYGETTKGRHKKIMIVNKKKK